MPARSKHKLGPNVAAATPVAGSRSASCCRERLGSARLGCLRGARGARERRQSYLPTRDPLGGSTAVVGGLRAGERPGVAAATARGRGFCNQHAYRWLREAHNVLGTAIIYRDVLASTLRTLDESAASDGQRGGLLRGLRSTEDGNGARRGACPACTTQREAEDRYLGACMFGDVLQPKRFGGGRGAAVRQGLGPRARSRAGTPHPIPPSPNRSQGLEPASASTGRVGAIQRVRET